MGRLTIVALLLASCTSPDGQPPLARIDISPSAILENDGFQTAVTLDGQRSADPVDHPEGGGTLRYQWAIEDDEVRIDDGRLSSAMVVVRLQGDRPARISLTVTDEDGLSATSVAYMQLTVR